ncbi:translation initiation factor eIF 4e-like domain-containing protein [Glomus cerebriforme]|uniref:Translation initiation factor eIF 4e-like domain-containing protein n=1 Tax=Glomus cerebriforme TaxID=658196 RepID=A0A397S9A2_9GLOM|nr:translation initiation factor eIF 4e-like domain-containing protein [Glomus cerebriforme]
MESPWKRSSNRLTVNTDHSNNNSTTTTTTTPTAITPTSTSSTKLIQLQRTNSPNGVTGSMAASTVLLAPTTPLGMGSGLGSSSGGSGYFAKRLSITGAGEDKDNKEKENGNSSNGLVLTRQQFTPSPTSEIHPLHFTWVFWFMHRSPGSKILNYESSMKKIAAFSSIEDFWAVYSHLRRPHELPNISDYHLFKQGVRPVWEDDTNISGGKWIVRLKKGLASRYWESLVMAVIGDQFDVGTEICGAVLSIRSSEDILSLWNQSAHEGRINLKIRDTMKRVLNLPSDTIMEYKTHNDALKDNSSFRNTDVFR